MPITLKELSVQLIISAVGEQSVSGANVGDGVWMYHVYAACYPPFALGIPPENVELYCGPYFLNYKSSPTVAIGEIVPGAQFNPKNGDGRPEYIFGGPVGEGEAFFDYFWDIFSRATSIVGPLPTCQIRIISGHASTTADGPAVVCGSAVPFHRLVEDSTQRNASVLTVLDCCLSPLAVRDLNDSNNDGEDPSGNAAFFTGLGNKFPVACVTTRKSFCFRLSWDGHHGVLDKTNADFAPATFPNMSRVIGFPVICSVMVAVKCRYVDRDQRDLNIIFVEQFLRINRRYYSKGRPLSLYKANDLHCQLDLLQSILDRGVTQLNRGALNDCLAYTRNSEWFTTDELETSLPSPGALELASEIAAFVRQCVMEWHSQQHKVDLWLRSGDSERAWHRLVRVMNCHLALLIDSTFIVQNSHICRVQKEADEDAYDYYPGFDEWAMACETLPDIVEKVVCYLENNKGKTLFDYAGVSEILYLNELPIESNVQSHGLHKNF